MELDIRENQLRNKVIKTRMKLKKTETITNSFTPTEDQRRSFISEL